MLTVRETQVLAGIARGKSNEEIAKDLGIGEATIKSHVARLLHKTDSTSRTGLVSWGYRYGYLQGLTKHCFAAPVMTGQQVVILQHVCMGYDSKTIASKLFCATNTVKTHVSHLLLRWGARNRQELVAWAWQTGTARLSWWGSSGDMDEVCPTCGTPRSKVIA